MPSHTERAVPRRCTCLKKGDGIYKELLELFSCCADPEAEKRAKINSNTIGCQCEISGYWACAKSCT